MKQRQGTIKHAYPGPQLTNDNRAHGQMFTEHVDGHAVSWTKKTRLEDD